MKVTRIQFKPVQSALSSPVRSMQAEEPVFAGHASIPPRRDGAFTLLEVLVTIAIFAILLAAIDGLLFGAIRLQTRMQDAIDEALPTDRAVTIIKRDIAGIIPPNGVICGGVSGGSYQNVNSTTIPGLSGPLSLEIYTTTGVIDDVDPSCDVQKIDYALANPTNRSNASGRDLVRLISHNQLSTVTEIPDQQRILENIQKLEVMFFDGTNWIDSWGSPDTSTSTNLPTAIRLRVDFASDRSSKQSKPQLELLLPVPTALINTNN